MDGVQADDLPDLHSFVGGAAAIRMPSWPA